MLPGGARSSARSTEQEALQRRIEGAQTPSHGQAGPAGAALSWIHVHLTDPTSIAHLSHVFAPRAPPDAAHCRAHSTILRRRGNGPGHARARRQSQEAIVWGLVAGAVVKAHATHAAALHDPAGSGRTFLGNAALPAVRALNGSGALTLLPAMHRVVDAVRLGLIDPEAALYGYCMDCPASNQSGRPPSMRDALQLTGEGLATCLHSRAPALLHALRPSHSMDAAPYLNQARTTYPGGMSGMDAALQVLHPPEEELEVG